MRAALLIAAVPLLSAASAPLLPAGETVDLTLQRARAEAAAADARVRKLEEAANKARDEAAQLRARQLAAAEAIQAAEARISAADSELKLISARIELRRRRLAREQQPVASLLAGLAMMGRRPPLLALADSGSTEEFVRVRLLLESSLPVIRRRTATLSREIDEGRRLEQSAAAARQSLVRRREELAAKREEFARIETRALQMAAERGAEAVSAGDAALVSGEEAELIAGEAEELRAAQSLAAQLAQLPPLPPRPAGGEQRSPAPPLAYVLPADAQVITGLGAVSDSGVRSRGITLATARATRLVAPASGVVRFSGPYRSYDGIVILDHGSGWVSLIVNAASPLKQGMKVRLGEPLGRALGPVTVELSRSGRHFSPALIAGSYRNLSNADKGG